LNGRDERDLTSLITNFIKTPQKSGETGWSCSYCFFPENPADTTTCAVCSVLKGRTRTKLLLLLGNTGAGKSSIGNLLRIPESPEFFVSDDAKSETQRFSYAPTPLTPWQVGDTPGVNDNANRAEMVLNEVRAALAESAEEYKYCFVVAPLASGRFASEDVGSIKTVLAKLPVIPPYYIMVNQFRAITPERKDNYLSSMDALLALQPVIPRPADVLFLPVVSNVADLRQQALSFMRSMIRHPPQALAGLMQLSQDMKDELKTVISLPDDQLLQRAREARTTLVQKEIKVESGRVLFRAEYDLEVQARRKRLERFSGNGTEKQEAAQRLVAELESEDEKPSVSQSARGKLLNLWVQVSGLVKAYQFVVLIVVLAYFGLK